MSVASASKPKPTKPSIPWKTKLAVSVISAVSDSVARSDGTINRRLLRFLDYKVPPNSTPRNSVSSSDTTVDPSRNLSFRLFSPTVGAGSLPVVVFFHGGGFTFLNAASRPYDTVCRRFARKFPVYVLSVNYRLAPEHKYPTQFDDGFDVLKYLDANRNVVLPENADLTRCFLAGDSAGANLAHHVAVRACRDANFDSLKLVGLMSIQPFFGGEERTAAERELVGSLLVSVPRTDFCWKVFLPEGTNRDHAAANVSGPNAEEIAGLDLPETVVVVAGFDPLQDWQRRYYEWMKVSGKRVKLIEYPKMIHAFYLFPELPEATDLIMQLKEFVAKCSGAGSAKL